MSPVARKIVGSWLLAGCIMVFIQVILGGITRLTESGLSITEWKPVKGTIPPLNAQEWDQEFAHYKEKIQYKIINEGMTVDEFKSIYYWEYFHRLNARLMLAVFVIPLIYFFFKGYIERRLGVHLAMVFCMAAFEGLMGWIMVSAGLKGLFVPPLSLATHLILASLLYAYLIYLSLFVFRGEANFGKAGKGIKILAVAIFVVLITQVFLGGILSGMKAGLSYPTWPDMNHELIPTALSSEPASIAGFLKYIPQDLWGKAFIQFMHRVTAFTLILLIVIFWFRSRNIATDNTFKTGLNLFPVFVLLQATIGILTVLNCIGKVPVSWGVLHQAGAMFLIAETVFVIFHLTSSSDVSNT